uniref:Ig-like domain-containing protein n=1 Tax=Panagrellus redivivus TaxID=6233 RepID=A0A7E4UQ12_PANRE
MTRRSIHVECPTCSDAPTTRPVRRSSPMSPRTSKSTDFHGLGGSWMDFPVRLAFIMLVGLTCFGGASAELRAKGIARGVIQVKSGKSIGQSVLQSIEPLILWCQAVNTTTHTPFKINSATFNAPHHSHEAKISIDGLTANLTLEKVPVTDAGKWNCILATDQGNATGYIDVFLRPIVFSTHAIRADPRDTSEFHLDATGVTVVLGEDAELTCPVFGRPVPKIQWRVGGKNVKLGDRISMNGTTLVIKNVTYDDEKAYTCVAENSFTPPHKKQGVTKNDLFLERKLRVKSPLAWLLPLILIIAILTLLGLIIGLCECRKRRNKQALLATEPEDE